MKKGYGCCIIIIMRPLKGQVNFFKLCLLEVLDTDLSFLLKSVFRPKNALCACASGVLFFYWRRHVSGLKTEKMGFDSAQHLIAFSSSVTRSSNLYIPIILIQKTWRRRRKTTRCKR